MAGEKLVLCELNKLQSECLSNSLFDEFPIEAAEKICEFHKTIPGYEATPLVDFQNTAKQINVEKIWTKDESKRFGLNAYKFLGVSYALALELHQDSNKGA